MTTNNKTNNISLHNANNIQLVILFPILPKLIDWKSILVTTTKIRPSSINEDIQEKIHNISKKTSKIK